jgi:hypothetical protein
MTILTWNLRANIENSIIEFLRSQITLSSLQLLNENGLAQTVNVYAGRNLGNWDLPLIQVYFDSTPDEGRLEIGSNKRLRSYQVIFDIRTILPGQESNLADWVEEKINDGLDIYDYTPNSSNPDVPVKSLLGHGRIDFVSSLPVPSFDDADKYDQNRYRISAKIWVNS